MLTDHKKYAIVCKRREMGRTQNKAKHFDNYIHHVFNFAEKKAEQKRSRGYKRRNVRTSYIEDEVDASAL